VYETTLVPHVITQPYDGILFFSPSAVHSFFLTNKIAAQTQVFAIGATTAGALQNYTANPVLTAVKTGKEELVQQMIRHFQSRKQEEA
jgi:uroporphyrinogen-III synthase